MNTLPPWQRRYNFGLREHRRQQDAANQGSNVAPSTPGIDIYSTPTSRGIHDTRAPKPAGIAVFPVVPLAALTPGGMYTCQRLDPSLATPINPSTPALTEAHIGARVNESLYLLNIPEVTFSTHDLTDSPRRVPAFIGWWHPVPATDGTRIVATWGFDWTTCAGGLLSGDLLIV